MDINKGTARCPRDRMAILILVRKEWGEMDNGRRDAAMVLPCWRKHVLGVQPELGCSGWPVRTAAGTDSDDRCGPSAAAEREIEAR
jgi:hypothetical protein